MRHFREADLHGWPESQAELAAQAGSVCLSELGGDHELNPNVIGAILDDLRFEERTDRLEDGVKTPDQAPVRRANNVVAATLDPFQGWKCRAAGARPVPTHSTVARRIPGEGHHRVHKAGCD